MGPGRPLEAPPRPCRSSSLRPRGGPCVPQWGPRRPAGGSRSPRCGAFRHACGPGRSLRAARRPRWGPCQCPRRPCWALCHRPRGPCWGPRPWPRGLCCPQQPWWGYATVPFPSPPHVGHPRRGWRFPQQQQGIWPEAQRRSGGSRRHPTTRAVPPLCWPQQHLLSSLPPAPAPATLTPQASLPCGAGHPVATRGN